MRKIALLLITLAITFLPAFAIESKDLKMQTGYSYLLSFDQKIVKYSIGNENAADIELVTSIFNDRHQVLIKPKKETFTNLILWTKDAAINFDMEISANKNNTPKIIVVKTVDGKKFQLDKPPSPKVKMYEFEIDTPPVMKKINSDKVK